MKSEKTNAPVNNDEKNSNQIKKTYISPTLTNYGSVSELTKGASPGATEMGTFKK